MNEPPKPFDVMSIEAKVESIIAESLGSAANKLNPTSWDRMVVAVVVAVTDHVKLEPIAMRMPCPQCAVIHIDEGEFASKPHHTHACQSCGMVWRPSVGNTIGVAFLPGYKNK